MKKLLFLITLFALANTLKAGTIVVQNTNDSGVGSLRQATIDAVDGDTISFSSTINGDTIKLTTGEITFSTSIVIIGNGAIHTIIDGNAASRIFYITDADSVSIHKLTIQNGYSAVDGGGILLLRTPKLSLSEVSVDNNIASTSGGGIASRPVNKDFFLTVYKSTVSNNTANSGGGIVCRNTSNGYTVNMNIVNSTICYNTAAYTYGGGIYSESSFSNITVTNSTITKNNALLAGGIYSEGRDLSFTSSTITLKSSIVADNDSINIYNNKSPDIVSLGYNIIGDSTLTGTVASDFLNVDSAQLNLSILQYNGGTTKNLPPTCESIVLDIGDPTDLSDAQNNPIVGGRRDIGASERTTTKIVTNTNDSGLGSLRQFVSDACSGDTIRFSPNLIASGSDTIKLASEIGINKNLVFKGLYNATDTLFISGEDSVRIFNIDLSSLTILYRIIRMDSLMLINGNAQGGSGGAIAFATPNSSLFISNSSLKNNSADSVGGAIYTYSSSTNSTSSFILNIEKSIISNNSANTGGGIYAYTFSSYDDEGRSDLTLTVSNSTISNNSAIINGGGIYANCFMSRHAILFSAICKAKLNMNITNSIISNNSANAGGGIYSFSNTFGDASTNSTFSKLVTELVLNITHSTISNNSAITNGGGIYSNVDSDANTNSPFSVSTPGADAESFLTFMISNSTIDNNSADVGGGIYSRSYADAQVAIGIFPRSQVYSDYDLIISNSTIFNNSAATNGGGIYSFSDVSQSSSSTTPNNHVVNSNLNTEITNGTIYNNSAPTGGGIYSFSDVSSSIPTVTVSNSSLNLLSTIIANNGLDNVHHLNLNAIAPINSLGYNIYSDSLVGGSVASDLLNVTPSQLNLDTLKNNGGTNLTLLPLCKSVAIDNGNPADTNDAQNISIIGARDIGATETPVLDLFQDTISTIANCDSVTYLGNTYFNDTIVVNTYTGILHCDSIISTPIKINKETITNANTIIACDSTMVNGNWYHTTQIVTDSLSAITTGCDSTVVTTVIINYSVTTNAPLIANCDSIVYLGTTYFNDTIITTIALGGASNGCDLITIQQLLVDSLDNNTTSSGLTITANQVGATYQWIDCTNGDTVISGETNQSYTATSNGDYAVIITNGSCIDTSSCVTIATTGLNQLTQTKFNVYPNPTNGMFTIDFGNNGNTNTTISIIDAIGKTIKQINTNNQIQTIDLSGCQNGVYFVKIDNTITRIIKQ